MDYLDQAVTKLSDAVRAIEEDMANQYLEGTNPALIRDRNGRYILLESYAALVNGLAAQENARRH